MDIGQTIIFLALSIALIVSIYGFFKTPKNKRYIIFPRDKHASDPNYAPEYSKQERITFIIKYGLIALFIMLVGEYYLFPAIKNYASNAHCYNYGNINGVHIIFYGIFVILPLSLAVILLIFEGKRSIQIIKIGQNPLPGEKVLRPTKYKYGFKAKIQPMFFYILIVLLIMLSVWGGFQANGIIKSTKPKLCSANNSNPADAANMARHFAAAKAAPRLLHS